MLSVRLGQLFERHEVDEEVVADLRVGVDALSVGLDNALGEDTRVLSIEEKIDSGKLDVLHRSVPMSTELFSLLVIGANEHLAPVSAARVVLAETLAWDGDHCAIRVPSVGDPLLGQPAVVLGVVERL